jgi:hypothetical protein
MTTAMRASRTLALTALLALAAAQVLADDNRSLDTAGAADTLNRTTLANDDQPAIARSALAPVPYDWKTSDAEQRATAWPAVQPTDPYTILTVFVPALLMVGFAVFGLTFAYRSMRADMRNQRIRYRPRGPARPSVPE